MQRDRELNKSSVVLLLLQVPPLNLVSYEVVPITVIRSSFILGICYLHFFLLIHICLGSAQSWKKNTFLYNDCLVYEIEISANCVIIAYHKNAKMAVNTVNTVNAMDAMNAMNIVNSVKGIGMGIIVFFPNETALTKMQSHIPQTLLYLPTSTAVQLQLLQCIAHFN